MKELPANYFDDVNDEYLEFLERIGEEGIKRKEQSFWLLRERCQKLAGLLIAGSSGVAAYLMGNWENVLLKHELVAVAFLWFACLCYLIPRCVISTGRPTAFYPPDILYQDGYELGAVRRTRLIWLADAQREIGAAGEEMSKIFNRALCTASFAPFIAILVFLAKWIIIKG